jgi:peptidoglycan lytic transglycosylase
MKRTGARLDSPLVYAAVGASILAIPSTAAAISAAPAQTGSGSTIKIRVKRHRIDYGRDIVVTGQAPAADGDHTATLEFWSSRSGGWQQIASSAVSTDGRFRLVAPLERSGWLRAIATAPTATTSALPLRPTDSASSSSAPERVAVAAAMRVHGRSIRDFEARTIHVWGRLLPARSGRRIALQAERSGRWMTLSRGRTTSRGTFRLRYRPSGAGQERLRVRFAGDRNNAAVSRRAGSLTVYHQTIASWYYDGGQTACGFHAYFGVANVSLPCGTKVAFSHHGRTVEAVVDDRGPYVGGRTWDLNENTAAALGFAGVGAVWSSR